MERAAGEEAAVEGARHARREVPPFGEGREELVEVVGGLVVEEDLDVGPAAGFEQFFDRVDDVLHCKERVRPRGAAKIGDSESV